MSTTAPVGYADRLDVSGTSPITMSTLVKVELRKMIDTQAGKWLLIITGVIVAIVMVIQLIVVGVKDLDISLGDFIASTAFSSGIFLPILGMLLVTQEWGQRTAMVSFTLVPHRSLVIAAKLLAGLAIALGAIVLALVLGVLVNAVAGVLTSGQVSWDMNLPLLSGFVLAQVIAVLSGFAIATLLLNTPAALVVFFVYSFVLPGIFGIGEAVLSGFGDVRPWLDFGGDQAFLMDGGGTKASDWGYLAFTGFFWLAVPFVAGLRRVLRAEVK